MASGAVSSSPGASQPRTTSGGAPAVVDMMLPRAAFLVFVSNIEDLLQPCHLRSVLTCSRDTSWRKMQGCITNLVKSFMDSQKLSKLAAKQCPSPSSWTEDVPICSSPFCEARTGLWLPSREEITRITQRPQGYPFEYMCADHKWGSLTLESVIDDHEDGLTAAWDHRGRVRSERRGLVACSLGCGKDLREIARIQKMGDYVLLASHHRVLPDADHAKDFDHGFTGDERYLLQSEIAGRDTPHLRALRAKWARMPPPDLRTI